MSRADWQDGFLGLLQVPQSFPDSFLVALENPPSIPDIHNDIHLLNLVSRVLCLDLPSVHTFKAVLLSSFPCILLSIQGHVMSSVAAISISFSFKDY